ncbi:60S ribosomal protein L43 [Marasmius tenuissimus]|nr:60S ribosomal protein L43 [Marasmius tenuissimus]
MALSQQTRRKVGGGRMRALPVRSGFQDVERGSYRNRNEGSRVERSKTGSTSMRNSEFDLCSSYPSRVIPLVERTCATWTTISMMEEGKGDVDKELEQRYGASLRKQVKKIEISQHSRYTCSFCGKDTVRRKAVGIWHCSSCRKTIAGGAWTVSTTAAATVRSTVRRLRELTEA